MIGHRSHRRSRRPRTDRRRRHSPDAPRRSALRIRNAAAKSLTPAHDEGRSPYAINLAVGLTDTYPHLRHLVFSTTLESHDPAIEIVRSSALDRVRELKAEEGLAPCPRMSLQRILISIR